MKKLFMALLLVVSFNTQAHDTDMGPATYAWYFCALESYFVAVTEYTAQDSWVVPNSELGDLIRGFTVKNCGQPPEGNI